MIQEEQITNEQLRQQFDNPFTLVNHAIAIARAMIRRGEGEYTTHLVKEVLARVEEGEDEFEEEEVSSLEEAEIA